LTLFPLFFQFRFSSPPFRFELRLSQPLPVKTEDIKIYFLPRKRLVFSKNHLFHYPLPHYIVPRQGRESDYQVENIRVSEY